MVYNLPVVWRSIEMIHLQPNFNSLELKGRTRTATLIEDII